MRAVTRVSAAHCRTTTIMLTLNIQRSVSDSYCVGLCLGPIWLDTLCGGSRGGWTLPLELAGHVPLEYWARWTIDYSWALIHYLLSNGKSRHPRAWSQ